MKNAHEKEFYTQTTFHYPTSFNLYGKEYLSVMNVCLYVPRNFWINTHGSVLKTRVFWGVTRVDWYTVIWLLEADDEATTILQNICDYSPIDTALTPQKTQTFNNIPEHIKSPLEST